MVLNFGLAAGVLYATRKSKLPFKQKLRKYYDEAVAKRQLSLRCVPYFKLLFLGVLILIQLWFYREIQTHKQQLLHPPPITLVTLPHSISTPSALPSTSKHFFIYQVLAHTVLIVVCCVQILVLKVDTLNIQGEHLVWSTFGLLKVSKKKIATKDIREMRVVRKGKDKFSHRTRKMGIRIFWEEGSKMLFQDFYETISQKKAKEVLVRVMGALGREFDEAKISSVLSDC